MNSAVETKFFNLNAPNHHFSLNMFDEVGPYFCPILELGASGDVRGSLVNVRSSQLKLQVDNVNTITINVISSKNNVTISVQNTVVSLSSL